MLINLLFTKHKLVSLIGSMSIFIINDAIAASVCYSEEKYPNITEIRQGKDGLEFVAGGVNIGEDNKSAPVITLTNDTAWDARTWAVTDTVKCASYGCLDTYKQCNLDVPAITLSVHDALNLRSFRYIPESIDQTISACVKDGENVYFGISFYAGEGVSGVGGVGRYNTESRDVEIRRLPILRDSSVTHIAFDGKLLWVATAHHYECSGTPPAVGLIRYDWEKNIIQNFQDVGAGLCGFVIHDIHITNKSAWVATDLGLSQADRTNKDYNYGWETGWRNYIPQIKEKQALNMEHKLPVMSGNTHVILITATHVPSM